MMGSDTAFSSESLQVKRVPGEVGEPGRLLDHSKGGEDWTCEPKEATTAADSAIRSTNPAKT